MRLSDGQWDVIHNVPDHDHAAAVLSERPDRGIGSASAEALDMDTALRGVAVLGRVSNKAGWAILIDDQVHARQNS
jgi:hypothetical protein